jgi:hypothetical protein
MPGAEHTDPLATVVDDVAATVEDCLQAVRRSYQLALDGEYTAKMWASDTARLWACGVRGWATAVNGTVALAADLAARREKSPADDDAGEPGDAGEGTSPGDGW